MKEQVKEWIADKNLTTDSFDSIMIGVIYNSYHNMLDDPDVRSWIGMHPSEFREMLPPNLNENQQIVLDWFKKEYKEKNFFPIECAWFLLQSFDNGYLESEEERAFENLNKLQEAQVLQVFSEWALEQEDAR